MRRWRTRSLVIFGSAAALYSDKLQDWWTGALGIKLVPDSLFSNAAVLDRQAAALRVIIQGLSPLSGTGRGANGSSAG